MHVYVHYPVTSPTPRGGGGQKKDMDVATYQQTRLPQHEGASGRAARKGFAYAWNKSTTNSLAGAGDSLMPVVIATRMTTEGS